MTTAIERLNNHIASLEAKLARAKAAREAINDPDLADIFSQNGAAVEATQLRFSPKRTRRATVFDVIREYFLDRANEWATIEEISRSTGKKDYSVRDLIYKSRPTFFERRKKPDDGRLAQIRLDASLDTQLSEPEDEK